VNGCDHDIIVVGAGELADSGLHVAVVERELAGRVLVCRLHPVQDAEPTSGGAAHEGAAPRGGGLPAVKARALTRVSSWYGERF
jgi:hypothetical protein